MKRAYRIGLFAVLTLFLAVSFNNCAQPKFSEMELKSLSTDLDNGNSGSGVPGAETPVVPKKLVSKSKTISIEETNKIDVLFVIDNSGSMAYEQKNMSVRFANFMTKINHLEWRIGFITTDMRTSSSELMDGRLIPITNLNNRRWMDSSIDSSVAEARFAETIQRSESGSGNEQGIAATYRAIERDKVDDTNSGFFRSSAALAVVVISDDDESPSDQKEKQGLSKADIFTSLNYYENLMKLVSTRWAGKAFIVNAIVVKSGDNDCLRSNVKFDVVTNSNESYGVEYEKAAAATGGVVGSVCAADYAAQLGDIGTGIAEAVKAVSLECAPVDGDGDGYLDIEVHNGTKLIQNYSVKGSLITFAEQISSGMTKIDYLCYE